MKTAFADTSYYLALVNKRDGDHESAVELARTLRCRVFTTAWVLTEVADALAEPTQRPCFLQLLAALRADWNVVIVEPTLDRFERGLRLYARRPDKAWSLTDCISFVTMDEFGLTDALTGDHHFEQAGFTIHLGPGD